MDGLNALWATDIVHGTVIIVVFTLSALALVYLLLRPPIRRWALTSLVAVSAGSLVAVLIWFVTVRTFNLFGMSLGHGTYLWLAATCAGISTLKPIALTPPSGAPTSSHPVGPLWRNWTPPAGLPSAGAIGTQVIPNTISGFSSRPAGIHLPPAALVPDAPALPLVVMLMGQPGNPDPEYIAATLDRAAARHGGLAPIVIVADHRRLFQRRPVCGLPRGQTPRPLVERHRHFR